jgi:hypothetical protein
MFRSWPKRTLFVSLRRRLGPPAAAAAVLQQVAGRDRPVSLPDEDLADEGLPDVDLPDVDLPDVDLPDAGGAAAWFGRRTSRWPDWPLHWLLAAKQRMGATVSVVIPARNEQRTVARVVTALVQALYGVELAALLDTAARHGLDAIAQVDLGRRGHRHQASHDLAVMAAELLAVAERRRPAARRLAPRDRLHQFVRAGGEVRPRSRPVPVHERPAVRSLADRRIGPGP